MGFTRAARLSAVLTAAALGLAACSPNTGEERSSTALETEATGITTVTFRLWDDVVAPAYEESFDAFMAQNPDIVVEVDVVPWGDYWERLPLDIQSGDMADIYWMNTANFATYADSGKLINIGKELGSHDEWVPSVAELYERDGDLWGVPQLWDSIALYYNADLTSAAGVDPSNLTFAPGAEDADTLLAAARALTLDGTGLHPTDAGFNPDTRVQFGFNGQLDLQGIYLNFLAQTGAVYQDESGQFAFDSEQGVAAFQYLYDLVNTWYVSPAAADTNTNGDITRDLFLQGKLALFQSGPYNLKTIAENATFTWGIAPMVAGPEGRISVVHGVAAVGNADSEKADAAIEVLRWLGSADGQNALATKGVSFPAAVDAQQGFVDYWAQRGVDVQPFIDAATGATQSSPVGVGVNAGIGAYTPILQDMMLGTIPVADAVSQAVAAGNAKLK